jgi:hypothetical protein
MIKSYKNNSLQKYPPYGKILAERQKFKNPPFLVPICTGLDAWQNAKTWQKRRDVCALVLTPESPPENLMWPVLGCICLVEWNTGPSEQQIINLIERLFQSNASTVIVKPLFENISNTAWSFDASKPKGQRWEQCREMIHIYHNERRG